MESANIKINKIGDTLWEMEKNGLLELSMEVDQAFPSAFFEAIENQEG